MRLTHSHAKLQALNAIPAPKRRTKTLLTLFGVLVFGGAWFLPKYLGFSWQVAVGVAAFGGICISKELVLTLLAVVPAFVRDLVRAFHGTGGESGPRPAE